MYFYNVEMYENEPELSGVDFWCTYCGTCGGRSLELDKFDEIVDGEYVILKDGVTLSCRKCGKVHEDRKILYKKTSRSNSEQYSPLSDLWLHPVTENQNLI